MLATTVGLNATLPGALALALPNVLANMYQNFYLKNYYKTNHFYLIKRDNISKIRVKNSNARWTLTPMPNNAGVLHPNFPGNRGAVYNMGAVQIVALAVHYGIALPAIPFNGKTLLQTQRIVLLQHIGIY